MVERTQAPPWWGAQNLARWETDQSDPRPLANCEMANALRDEKSAPSEQRLPVGVWRVSAVHSFGSDQIEGTIIYGTGNNALTLTRVLLPCVAYIPGFATLTAAPVAPATGLNIVTCTVVPMFEAAAQRVRTFEDASVAAVLLPGSAVRLTALEAITYTPFGAAAPIVAAAGATVEIAGRTTLDTGRAAAWHEL